MTSPKTYKRYATQWLDLFYVFKDEPTKTHTFQCDNATKAKAMRLEFYKAREAFLKDPDMRKEFESALNGREVRLTEDNRVIFDFKDNNWIGKVIADGLQQEEEQ